MCILNRACAGEGPGCRDNDPLLEGSACLKGYYDPLEGLMDTISLDEGLMDTSCDGYIRILEGLWLLAIHGGDDMRGLWPHNHPIRPMVVVLAWINGS